MYLYSFENLPALQHGTLFYMLKFNLVSFVVCFLLLSCLNISNAQTLFGVSEVATLKANPSLPGPNTVTTISLDDYSLNTVGARISWSVNGVEVPSELNKRSIEVTTGKLGQKTTVKATIARPTGAPLSASITLTPVAVAIILEAQTYTPTFYTGRPLPSMDAPMRAIAVVQTGTPVSPATYSYTWSLDTTVLGGGAIKGKHVLDFTMPRYDRKSLSVQVYDQNGILVGRSSVTLDAEEPELLFYEQSPLRGLQEKVIASPFPLLGDEVTLYGEPYYLHRVSDADYSWTIDGSEATPDTNTPNAITLQSLGTTGNANIDLEVVTRAKIPQFVSGGFNLFLQ